MYQLYKNARWQFRESRTHRITIVLIGLDGAGKTTVCNSLGGQPDRNVMPTVGFNKPVQLKMDGFEIKIMDIGGVRSFRPQWTSRLARAHACIFVVDCAELDRLVEARDELARATSHEQFKGKPVLILANKQDIPGALDEIQMSQALGLDQGALSYCSNNMIKCVASKKHNNREVDPALKMGLHWLVTAVSGSWSTINARVNLDVKAMDKEELRRRAETSKIVAERKRIRREKQAAEEAAKVAGTTTATGGGGSGDPAAASSGIGNVKRNSVVPHGKIGELASSQRPAGEAGDAGSGSKTKDDAGAGAAKPKAKAQIVCKNMLLQANSLVACENEATVRNMATGWMPFCDVCHQAVLQKSNQGAATAAAVPAASTATTVDAGMGARSALTTSPAVDENNNKAQNMSVDGASNEGMGMGGGKENNVAPPPNTTNVELSKVNDASSQMNVLNTRQPLPPLSFPQANAQTTTDQQQQHDAKMAEEPDVGERVHALFHGKNMWYTGKVTAQTWDPEAGLWTYDVTYDDGDEESGIKRENICRVEAKSLRKGHKVLAKYRGKGQIFGAVVDDVNETDGTYQITYEDGECEGSAKRYWLKRVRKHKHKNKGNKSTTSGGASADDNMRSGSKGGPAQVLRLS